MALATGEGAEIRTLECSRCGAAVTPADDKYIQERVFGGLTRCFHCAAAWAGISAGRRVRHAVGLALAALVAGLAGLAVACYALAVAGA